jgi:hypothetical protein
MMTDGGPPGHQDSGRDADPPAVHDLPPGGPEARAQGCCCSVLANAAHRVDARLVALVDPACPVHDRRPQRPRT